MNSNYLLLYLFLIVADPKEIFYKNQTRMFKRKDADRQSIKTVSDIRNMVISFTHYSSLFNFSYRSNSDVNNNELFIKKPFVTFRSHLDTNKSLLKPIVLIQKLVNYVSYSFIKDARNVNICNVITFMKHL